LFLYIAALAPYRMIKKSFDRCFLNQKTETMHVEWPTLKSIIKNQTSVSAGHRAKISETHVYGKLIHGPVFIVFNLPQLLPYW